MTETLMVHMGADAGSGFGRGRLRLWCRVVLAVTGVESLELSLWSLVAPHHFFEHFPGAGRHWVAPLGVYNEHLTRDYGAAILAVAVLSLWGAITLSRPVVQSALVAAAVSAAPHFAYHLTTTAHYGVVDNITSVGALGLEALVPAALLFLLVRQRS